MPLSGMLKLVRLTPTKKLMASFEGFVIQFSYSDYCHRLSYPPIIQTLAAKKTKKTRKKITMLNNK